MRKRYDLQLVIVLLTAMLLIAMPVMAQRPAEEHHEQGQHPSEARPVERPRANQGRIPPPPPQRQSHTKVEVERHESGKINGAQHVSKDHWYGHDAPNDKRFHLEHPFEHGRFEHFGPSYRYRVERFDRDHHRFWFPGGFYFEVAQWDWSICADWCWDCGDDFVVYEDPDHAGWYLLYNVHTGVYVHVNYMGT
ncbi:MAG: hypothetical protein WBL63_25520 [Candidatus Acidiferrum sp.]